LPSSTNRENDSDEEEYSGKTGKTTGKGLNARKTR
jgi:hypothetical protein